MLWRTSKSKESTGGGAILDGVVREGLFEEATSEQMLKIPYPQMLGPEVFQKSFSL